MGIEIHCRDKNTNTLNYTESVIDRERKKREKDRERESHVLGANDKRIFEL